MKLTNMQKLSNIPKFKFLGLFLLSAMVASFLFMMPITAGMATTTGSFDPQNPSSAVADSQVTIAFTKCSTNTAYIVVIQTADLATNIGNYTFSTGDGQTTGQITFTTSTTGSLVMSLYEYNVSTGIATGSVLATGLFTSTQADQGNLIFNNLTIIVLMFIALIALAWLGKQKI